MKKDSVFFSCVMDVLTDVGYGWYRVALGFLVGCMVGLFCVHLLYSDLVERAIAAREQAVPAVIPNVSLWKEWTRYGSYVLDSVYDSATGTYKEQVRFVREWDDNR